MSTPSLYSDGTISVTNGSAAFTGSGTAWSTQLKRGTQIVVAGVVGVVASIESDTAGTLAETWPGTTAAGADYVAETWTDGAEIAEAVRTLLEELIGKGLAGITSGTPDAAVGRDNELRVDIVTGVLYQKRSGQWFVVASGFAFDAYGDATASPSDRDQYDEQPTGFTFFSLPESGFYVLLTTADADASPVVDAEWSDLVSLKGADGDSRLTGASATSLAIETGSKTFATEDDRQWTVGTRLRAASDANPDTHWMEGVVASYASGSLEITVDKVKGSGSRADWSIGVAGEPSSVAGADGTDPGLLYDFDTDTTAGADAGTLRADDADLTAAAWLYFADLDRSNNDMSAFLATVGDSTSASPKGHIRLKRTSGGNAQTVFAITGAAVDEDGYTKVPVSFVSGADGYLDDVVISAEFELRGDAGSGANAFTDLTDTPASFSGAGSKLVRVNSGATALEFVTAGDAAYKNTGTGAGSVAAGDDSRITGAAQKASNLSDLASAATARSNLGVDAAGIPQNSNSAAYTLVLGDAQKHILHPSADTTARTFTIPANSSVAFPIGTAVTFINQNGGGVITIAITTDTMRLAGAGTTGSRSLAANGIATAVKIASTEWIISGVGLT